MTIKCDNAPIRTSFRYFKERKLSLARSGPNVTSFIFRQHVPGLILTKGYPIQKLE
jgi:hypothetical protein